MADKDKDGGSKDTENTAIEKQPIQTAESRNYADVDITDDFMFSYIMRNPEICIALLECLFPDHKIQKVVYIYGEGEESTPEKVSASPEIQKTLVEAFGKRGVRLDVYLDDGKTVYNVEMEASRKGHMGLRIRYYHSEIDSHLIWRGAKYKELKPCFVVFICKFDPFGRGLYKYTFSQRCHEVDGLDLGDNAYTLFFSTVGTKDCEKKDGTVEKISDELKELLRYMNDTKSYPVENYDNELIRKIDAAVNEAKDNEEWRRAYMTYWTRLQDEREEGREEGRDEGRLEKARETTYILADKGFQPPEIAEIVRTKIDTVRKWLESRPVMAK